MRFVRWGLLAVGFAGSCLALEPQLILDFKAPGHGWKGNPRTRDPQQSAAGFSVQLTGEDDPWLEGPAVAVPAPAGATKVVLTLTAECEGAGSFELFYAPPGQPFSADAMVRADPVAGEPGQYQCVLPQPFPSLRFRLDPPGCSGNVRLVALRARPLIPLGVPSFARPPSVTYSGAMSAVDSGALRVEHLPGMWNAWACRVGGRKMAEGNTAEELFYADGTRLIPVALARAETVCEKRADGFAVRARVRDEGGATWTLARRFTAVDGGIRIETSCTVDAAREVAHLPWLTLFSGLGSFGESKRQALLPGVEYLSDEPSSNEKEIRGPAANRRMPAAYKICYPLMALAADGQWLSVEWEAGAVPVSPLFDSPDRVFGSGGHVFGLWSPAVGEARFESDLAVYGGFRLQAGQEIRCIATLRGGAGDAVTEAVASYVRHHGLPPRPVFKSGFDDACRLLAAGWLDSDAREGVKWRHAVWGDHFPFVGAEDVPAYLLWLAAGSADAPLKARLADTAHEAIAALPKGCFGVGGISHVKRPTGALLYGDLDALVTQAGAHAKRLAAQLADGHARYKPGAKADYASTLGSDYCNGFTALSAEEMLGQASLTGDEEAIAASLAVLDKMTAHYAGQVPRGAQPWEMPLHTPDIVASARLVRCYVLGYLLSGREAYLQQARYWAWTGVTMVYLAPPTERPVGLYATIGVIGATNWQSPNWIGQPVQWCGLVYRSALEELARVDAEQRDVWQGLARGITVTGLEMCFPAGDAGGRGGLLPDFYLLRQQVSDGPAINPGTLEANLAEAYGRVPLYTVTRLPNGSLLHVPGEVKVESASDGSCRASVQAWPEGEYRALLTRVPPDPSRVRWNGEPATCRPVSDARVRVVTLRGSGTLTF